MRHFFPAILCVLLLGASTAAAFQAGGRCFANRTTVGLLASPDRAAARAGSVSWGTELSILATNGRWLQVRHAKTEGWVYSGNVSLEKPPAENKADILPTAGETGAAVAARPLSSTTQGYANRKSQGEAYHHLQWLETFTDALGTAEITAYQKQSGRGEYTP
jgi:hypothetical protein